MSRSRYTPGEIDRLRVTDDFLPPPAELVATAKGRVMDERDEELDEKSWEIRETFAYFGLAYYMACCLEVGLAHSLMYGEFLMQEHQKLVAAKGRGFDRKRYERDFDAFMEKHFAKTMGGVAQLASKLPNFSDELKKRIEEARKRRNFLAHHYWRERSVKFANSCGREEMREELAADRDMFAKLDKDIDEAMKSTRVKLNIDDKKLAEFGVRMMQQMIDGTYEEDEPHSPANS